MLFMSYFELLELLFCYTIVVVINVVAASVIDIPKKGLSADQEMDKMIKSELTSIGAFMRISIGGVLVFLLSVIGFVGMLCLWHLAPFIFCAGVIGRILLTPLLASVYSMHWVTYMSAEIVSVFEGVILALIFFGPARHLFYLT